MTLLRKALFGALLVIAGIIVGLAVSLSAYYFTGHQVFADVLGIIPSASPSASIGKDAANSELTDYAFSIVQDIKNGDYKALSQAVHPDYGVVFSPYATISLASDKCFTAQQVAGFADDKNKYVWGKYDGSGSPIELTPADYFKSFVFDRDYTLASEIGVDTVVKSGNSLENMSDIFPNARFVDFYIPGTKDSGGMDWGILRLGFEEYKGQLKLTVIVHSEWTI